MGTVVRVRQPHVLRRRWQEVCDRWREVCDAWDEECERPGAVQPSLKAIRHMLFGARRKP